MNPTNAGYLCGCGCHGNVKIHITATCDCGRPVTPPNPDCGGKRRRCPPPPPKTQPGVVNVPQPTAPPTFTTSGTPIWQQGKPSLGDPSVISWFQGQINQIGRKGPSFGPRKNEFLPYLLIRTNAGDCGARPITGVFWESPDIYVTPNQDAGSAPLLPATLGGIAQANAPNTLYAHVWNFGKAPAYRLRVEFYWFNPSLGITRADANLIGAAWIDLANRFTLSPTWTTVTKSYGEWVTQGCHAIVRCPTTWVPTFENNGHECLVVRVFEPMMDSVSPDEFSAANSRHVAQRNIAVVTASSPASIDLGLHLGYPDAPGDAEVDVTVDGPATMDWLQLFAGTRTPGFKSPVDPVVCGFLPPAADASRLLSLSRIPVAARIPLLKAREKFQQGCCPLQIAFHASIANMNPKEAAVLRIRHLLTGDTVGGYSVVLVKP